MSNRKEITKWLIAGRNCSNCSYGKNGNLCGRDTKFWLSKPQHMICKHWHSIALITTQEWWEEHEWDDWWE